MNKSEFYSFLKTVPKAELHIHIEAVISRDSIKKLYLKKNGKKFSEKALKELFNYSDLNGFIAAFIEVQNLFTEVSDFDLVFDDLKNYLVRNGITHCEAFFAPSSFIKKGFSYEEMAKNFEKNLKKIKKETGITVWLLGDVSRTFGLDNASKNLDMFLANKFDGFIGIGLGGADAGEDVGPQSIWDAIELCRSERIGHGISAIQDEKLMEKCVKEQIPFEVAPTSNVFTKKYVKTLSEHPFRPFFDRGMLVTLNTDDPLFFGVELLDEYWNLHKSMKFKMDEIKQVVINSFKASFLSDSEKEKAVKSVENAWKVE